MVLGEQLSQQAAFDAIDALRAQGFLFTRKAPALAAALAAKAEAESLGFADEKQVDRNEAAGQGGAPAAQALPSLLFPGQWDTSAGGGWLRWLGGKEITEGFARNWQWAVHQSA